MKTAISIPDELFRDAEELADRLGYHRSQLYTEAVRQFLARHGEDPVTARLDRLADHHDATGDEASVVAGRDAIASGRWEW